MNALDRREASPAPQREVLAAETVLDSRRFHPRILVAEALAAHGVPITINHIPLVHSSGETVRIEGDLAAKKTFTDSMALPEVRAIAYADAGTPGALSFDQVKWDFVSLVAGDLREGAGKSASTYDDRRHTVENVLWQSRPDIQPAIRAVYSPDAEYKMGAVSDSMYATNDYLKALSRFPTGTQKRIEALRLLRKAERANGIITRYSEGQGFSETGERVQTPSQAALLERSRNELNHAITQIDQLGATPLDRSEALDLVKGATRFAASPRERLRVVEAIEKAA